MSEPTIDEACWDIQVSTCWIACVVLAATSAGTLADASSAFNRSSPGVQELGHLDEERDQREGDQQQRAAHDQDRGADRSTGSLGGTPSARTQALVERPEGRDGDDGEQDGEGDRGEIEGEPDDEGTERDRDQDAPADGRQTAQPARDRPRSAATAAGSAEWCPSATSLPVRPLRPPSYRVDRAVHSPRWGRRAAPAPHPGTAEGARDRHARDGAPGLMCASVSFRRDRRPSQMSPDRRARRYGRRPSCRATRPPMAQSPKPLGLGGHVRRRLEAAPAAGRDGSADDGGLGDRRRARPGHGRADDGGLGDRRRAGGDSGGDDRGSSDA